MPTIVPGKKIRPVVLVESTRVIIPERRARRTIGAAASWAVAPSARVASIRAPRVGHLVAEPVQRHRRGGHRVADHHAADRDQVARRRFEDAEGDDEAEGGAAGERQRDQQRPEGARHLLRARLRAVSAPKTTITASSAKTSQSVSASKISLIA